ncbi:MAG: ABC transporter permease [Caldilineaceae bacterium]|nr:ABC transporter permease [Caldilineaceae bacterium]
MFRGSWWRWAVLIAALIAAALLFQAGGRRLSFNIWLGAIATGLAFSLVALGVYLSFRVLDFPDLTIDGSMPLGAALSATLIVAGVNPYLTLPAAFIGGALAGLATALIATRLQIHSLLASILVTTGLISINLRIMGRSNIPLLNVDTIFTPFADTFRTLLTSVGGTQLARMANNILAILLFGVIVLVVKWGLDWFMRTEIGLAVRATGDNRQMIRALGVNSDAMIVLGLALSNGLVGLAGALIAQYQGFADVNMGLGLIIAGLAAVILGETFFRPTHFGAASTAAILGMIIYRIAIAAALVISLPLPNGETFNIDAQDVKLVTALLVLGSLALAQWQKKRAARPVLSL